MKFFTDKFKNRFLQTGSSPGSLAFALLLGLTLASGAWAVNAPLSGFEVEGDILVGGTVPPEGSGPPSPPFSATAADVDWGPRAVGDENCAGPVCSALAWYNIAANCLAGATAPCDNINEPGDGEFFQDGLKSEGDLTTFTQGDKENDYGVISAIPGDPSGALQSTTPWHIVPGGVQPNKDDLFNNYAYSLISGTQADVVLAFERTNNNGSSHVDFELNRFPWIPCASGTATCPLRAEGDVLISYEITQGGAVSGIQFFMWELPGGIDADGDGNVNCVGFLAPGGNQSAPCPWQEVNFDPNDVFSTLNPQAIPAGPWGSKLPDGTPTNMIGEFGFFETFLDFDELGFGPGCPGFATVSLKSRASGSSVTSALSDLAGPNPLDLNNCAQITIIKDASPADGTDFPFSTSTNFEVSGNAFTLDDDASPPLSDTKVFSDLTPSYIAGNYVVTETPIPSGWTLENIVCVDDNAGTFMGDVSTNTASATINLQPEQEVTCTFYNEGLGSIKIVKQTNPDGAPGAFTFTAGGFTFAGDASTSLSDDGMYMISDLPSGTYTATESDPTGNGYKLTDITCVGDASGGTTSTTNLGTGTATFKLDPGEDLVCTFTNSTGAILINKTAKNYALGGVKPQSGVTFNVDASGVPGGTYPGGSGVTDASGNLCIDGLIPGVEYAVTETVPANYSAAGANPKSVTVTAGATCSIGTPDMVSFVNDPLSKLDITFTSKAGTGVTVAPNVSCTGPGGYSSGEKGVLGDDGDNIETATFDNLLEGTYTCTIYIDP